MEIRHTIELTNSCYDIWQHIIQHTELHSLNLLAVKDYYKIIKGVERNELHVLSL